MRGRKVSAERITVEGVTEDMVREAAKKMEGFSGMDTHTHLHMYTHVCTRSDTDTHTYWL